MAYLDTGDFEVRDGELKSSDGISKYGSGTLPVNSNMKMANGTVLSFENSGGTESGSIARDDDSLKVDSGVGGTLDLEVAGTSVVEVKSSEVSMKQEIAVYNSGETEKGTISRDDDDLNIDSGTGGDLQLKRSGVDRISMESDGTYVRDTETAPLILQTDDATEAGILSRDKTSLKIDSGTGGDTRLLVEGTDKVTVDDDGMYPTSNNNTKNGKSGNIWSETRQGDIYQYDTHYMLDSEVVQTNSESFWVTGHTYATTGGSAVQIEAWATGLDAVGNAAGYHIKGLFKNISGTVTQIGTTTGLSSHEDQSVCDIRFFVSGTDILTQVTGTANVMNWYVNLRVQEVPIPV